MKILVTGGAGFIGSNIIRYINNVYPEYDIVNLDKVDSDSNFENIRYVKGDISDRSFIFDLFEKEKFNVVVNFAHENNISKHVNDQSIFTITNIIGAQALLDASKECGVRSFHQVSTSDVYKELKSEDLPSYTASMLASDILAKAYEKEYDLNVTISRCERIDNMEQYCENIADIINNGVSGNIYNI